MKKILLIIPPFTQLNTPYPATAYLKGFFNTKSVTVEQMDLGLELILSIFSKKGMQRLFDYVDSLDFEWDDDSYMLYKNKNQYIDCVEEVISFLQGKNATLSYKINSRKYLPESKRFERAQEMDWQFGQMGQTDLAKFYCTLFIEDIGDFITAHIDPFFSFTKYAERISRAASNFQWIETEIQKSNTFICQIMIEILEERIKEIKPDICGFTVPFPGNLFATLVSAKIIKKNYPHMHTVMGGGYVNTELRSISDERFFNYIDFLLLDDGELPFWALWEYLSGKRAKQDLKRTFLLENQVVQYINNPNEKDIPQRETGIPDYEGLKLDQYISTLDSSSVMQNLWTNGRWNKLTLAHGCYWGKCTFCDINLDYISRYEPLKAHELCDRIEALVQQTGQKGFHFVDEAAPPALLRDLAIEILRRKIQISWWTNIRFEKSFNADLCKLLSSSGCIAVSGGLEVASDRLLHLMEKGVTVAQVARVAQAFQENGIMVHAYLMYGFPTQTEQETIDAMEVVRQMFEENLIHSAFWHQFAMTAHSPVGKNPSAFKVLDDGPIFEGFADNDRYHKDPNGAEHEKYSKGLSWSLHNYMMKNAFEQPLSYWFDFKIPKTKIPPHYIRNLLQDKEESKEKRNQRLFWMGNMPDLYEIEEEGETIVCLHFYENQDIVELQMGVNLGHWLYSKIEHLILQQFNKIELSDWERDFEKELGLDFNEFKKATVFSFLKERGLLLL
jgi:radical SAM superfamily enzyme YgiQ (UPF0313 family)